MGIAASTSAGPNSAAGISGVAIDEPLPRFAFAPKMREDAQYSVHALPNRIVYDEKKHGDFNRFIESKDGKKLRQQFYDGLDDVVEFLGQNRTDEKSQKRLEQQKQQLKIVAERINRGSTGYYSSHFPIICSYGKSSFDTIIAAIHDPQLAPQRIADYIDRLPTDVTVCAPGTITNLHDIAEHVEVARGGHGQASRKAYRDQAEAMIRDYAQTVHGNEEFYSNNEIHYVNGYRNYLSETVDVPNLPDSFVPSTVHNPESLAICEQRIKPNMSASAFIHRQAEIYLDEWNNAFPEKTVLSETDITSDQFRLTSEALDRRFGKVNLHDVFNFSDDEATCTYHVDQNLLERAIAKNLRDVGLLKPYKSVTIAGIKNDGRVIKQLNDTMFFLKTYAGRTRLERRALRQTDLDQSILQMIPKHRVEHDGTVSLFMYAVEGNNVEAIRNLCEIGVDSNARDRYGNTALGRASFHGNLEAIEELFAHGAWPNETDFDGDTPLAIAIKRQKSPIISTLLDHHASIDMPIDADGNTPLLIAAQMEDRRILDILINHRAGMHTSPNSIREALVTAERAGHPPIVSLLLKRFKKLDVIQSAGLNILMQAANSGDLAMMKSTLDGGINVKKKIHQETALIIAAKARKSDAVKLLCEYGADIDAEDADRNTALMHAVMNNDIPTITALLNHKADATKKNKAGENALILAAAGGHVKALSRLYNTLVNINVADGAGNTALMRATAEGHGKAVRHLLTKKADITRKNLNGNTALMLAAAKGHTGIAQMLLEKNPNLAKINNDGETALIIAAANGSSNVVCKLLRHDSNIDAMDMRGNTVLMRATISGRVGIVEMLLRKHADKTLKNKAGETALSLSKKYGYAQITELLDR